VEICIPEYTQVFSDFSVQITPIFNGQVRVLNAGIVENGKFKVYGESGSFYWTVFGKRNSIDVEPSIDSVVLNGDGPYTYITPRK
jgi:hypothetical protein